MIGASSTSFDPTGDAVSAGGFALALTRAALGLRLVGLPSRRGAGLLFALIDVAGFFLVGFHSCASAGAAGTTIVPIAIARAIARRGSRSKRARFTSKSCHTG